jgi:peptide/nickel transport system substrate-binding protein
MKNRLAHYLPPLTRRSAIRLALGGAITQAALAPRRATAAIPADTLLIARNIDDTLTLDPQEAFEISCGDPLNNLYMRLVGRDSKDLSTPAPGVAASWTQAADGRSMVFHIRTDLVFQSGRPVTAEDAAFSLQRGILLAKTPAFIIRQFGWTKDNVRDMVRADGGNLALSFARPIAIDLALGALTAAIASVVDKQEVLAHEKDGDLGNSWLRTHSAGCGPYRLVEWRPKEAFIFAAFPKFHAGVPKLRQVIVRHVPDPSAQRLLLEKGDVDVAFDLTPDQIQAVSANPALRLERMARGSVFYIGLNQQNPILAKPKVWEALRWLIDYEGISRDLFHGGMRINQSFLAAGVPDAVEDAPYKFDVAKGKALLAEAGYPDGFPITFDAVASSPYSDIAQSLQGSFGKAGIKVDLRIADITQVLSRYRQRQQDMIVFVKALDYNDPNALADFFTRNDDDGMTNPNRNAAWRNHWLIPELTQRTTDATSELDPAKRRAIYEDLQRTVMTHSPLIMAFQQIDTAVTRAGVTGYRGGPSYDSTYYDAVSKA